MSILPRRPHFAVVGAGPMGATMAAFLARASHHVVVLDIAHQHIQAIRQDGIIVGGIVDLHARVEQAFTRISALAGQKVDVLFVSVKAPILHVLVPRLKDVLPSHTVLVSLQNGMDTEQVLADAFGEHRTLRIVANYAGALAGPGRAQMTFFNKPNYIGPVAPAGRPVSVELAQIISSCGLETAHSDHIRRFVWEKVILNVALSPLCALTGQLMKEAMTDPATLALVKDILREGIAVAKADGHSFPGDFLQFCLDYLGNAGFHKPSMMVDVQAGRRTENEFLSGKVVEYGRRLGVETPVNDTIYRLIKGRESTFQRS